MTSLFDRLFKAADISLDLSVGESWAGHHALIDALAGRSPRHRSHLLIGSQAARRLFHSGKWYPSRTSPNMSFDKIGAETRAVAWRASRSSADAGRTLLLLRSQSAKIFLHVHTMEAFFGARCEPIHSACRFVAARARRASRWAGKRVWRPTHPTCAEGAAEESQAALRVAPSKLSR